MRASSSIAACAGSCSRARRSAELSVGEGEEVLARTAGRPAWTGRGDSSLRRVGSAPRELFGDESLKDAIHSNRGLAIIALLELVRQVTAPHDFDAPPLRAAILFDDPNLRRTSYGFIRYSDLIDHADAHGYHASIAMIPIDGRFSSRSAVGLFHDRPDRVSLTFHGNSHRKRELLRPATMADALALCGQAVRRIERFEARSGLSVDRVMTAPHGMCSQTDGARARRAAASTRCARSTRTRGPSDRRPAGR